MRIASVRFADARSPRPALVQDGRVHDLAALAPDLPRDMTALLGSGPGALGAAQRALEGAGAGLSVVAVALAPVVPRPGKFLALGMNYAAHIAELGRTAPEFQTWFNKQITCANGPRSPVHRPRASEQLDYEGELGVIIGRRCRHVPRDRAFDVIAGYCVVNDLSVRDWQWRVPTFTLGKSWDTHGPMGPWLVTRDEIPDPHALTLRTWVNGELRQESTTGDMVFDIPAMIEHLSTAFTLEPGDVLATGTPSGVGGGFDPPRWLVPGDVVRVAIEGIGELVNEVILEPEDTAFIG